MSYTVNKLAKLSGVSSRTLHFYDEIGLLKPAYYGENNYRYYEEEQLLILQQILFYRELGISLNEIQRIISSDNFNKIEALQSHKIILEKNMVQTKNLIKTIDKTIAHLGGNMPMKLEEIFHGFTAEKQYHYQNYLIDHGVSADVMNQCNEKTKSWEKGKWLKVKEDGDAIHKELVIAINNHLTPDSPDVQKIIKKHYEFTKQFWTPTRESYIGLSQLYDSHSDFRQFYNNIHPELLGFLMEAMKIFAEHEL
jgi:DNA-binding transcriptional MerR regulator